MQAQLTLIETPDWQIDEHTREVGRQGIARARAALEAASAHAPESPNQHSSAA